MTVFRFIPGQTTVSELRDGMRAKGFTVPVTGAHREEFDWVEDSDVSYRWFPLPEWRETITVRVTPAWFAGRHDASQVTR